MPSRIKRLRPSPATIISCISLFVALSGVAYGAALAKNSVGTRQIKTNGVGASEIKSKAVRSSEVNDNALTGTDIDESTLGTVPNATNATNATSVGGNAISKVNVDQAPGTGLTTIFSSGGLTVKASCAAGPALTLVVATSQTADLKSWTVQPDAGGAVAAFENMLERDPFLVSSGDVSLLGGLPLDADENDKLVHVNYRGNDGSFVSGEFDIDEPETDFTHCGVRGFATTG